MRYDIRGRSYRSITISEYTINRVLAYMGLRLIRSHYPGLAEALRPLEKRDCIALLWVGWRDL